MLLPLSEPQFLTCKMGITVVLVSKGRCESSKYLNTYKAWRASGGAAGGGTTTHLLFSLRGNVIECLRAWTLGNSLAVQWLRLCAFTAEGMVLTPGQGTKPCCTVEKRAWTLGFSSWSTTHLLLGQFPNLCASVFSATKWD